jgi:hypothetical protein
VPGAQAAEEDFAQAFAELAEMAAAEELAKSAVPGAQTGAGPDTADASEAAFEIELDTAPPAAAAADPQSEVDDAFEIELDAAPPAAGAAAANSDGQPEAGPDHAADPADDAAFDRPHEPALDKPVDPHADTHADPAHDTLLSTGNPAAAAALDDIDLAVLDEAPAASGHAPAGPAPAAASTLRDRAMARAHPASLQADPHASRPAAPQGALLAEHHGYRPPPPAQIPHMPQGPQGDAAEFGYGENFMAPLSPRAVARWVARHGRALLDTPSDGPVRRVSGAVMPGGAQHGAVYVLTAAIDGGAMRSRVLLGAGSNAAVLGPRLWSLPRLSLAGVAAASLLMAAGLGVSVLLQPAVPPVALEAQAAAVAAAASAAAASAAAASASASASASPPASAAASAAASSAATAASAAVSLAAAESAASTPAAAPEATAPAASAAERAPVASVQSAASAPATAARPAAAAAHPPAHESAAPVAADPHKAAPAAHLPAQAPAAELPVSTTRPAPAYARKGVLALPARGLALSDEAKEAARQAVADARAALPAGSARSTSGRKAVAAGAGAEGADAADGAATEAPTAPARAGTAAPAAVVPKGPVFAVSTRPLRTRAEAEQLQAAMGALLRTTGAAGVKLELLPEGEDWRVVAWPFTSQADADRARALLVGRGMRVQVLRF